MDFVRRQFVKAYKCWCDFFDNREYMRNYVMTGPAFSQFNAKAILYNMARLESKAFSDDAAAQRKTTGNILSGWVFRPGF